MITFKEEIAYFEIPADYCRAFGDLRWCDNGEAVEHVARDPSIGCTFAMAGEIALFLEGYRGVGPLVCFGFVLHLLHLLGLGTRELGPSGRSERFDDLAAALRETGRPIRNAGALCALLCRDLPRAADPPDPPDLARYRHLFELESAPIPTVITGPLRFLVAEEPPLGPAEFEARVLKALAKLSPADVRHWLRHGRGPLGAAGEEVARAVPRDFGAILADLGRRPRLAGALPLVERLAGALALPPRRLAQSELPTGGYADITTRGRPEQILPAQFALEPIEFLRRFAGRELLYFHREEPRDPAAEELVIVVDQGVRTWGDVRLVLAAAALAMVRRAIRRGTPTRISTTAATGRFVAYDGTDPEILGNLLEASDLSPHPGAALGYVLDEPGTRPRDILLLTHPRSLHEPEVAAVSRRAEAGTRLFAIAVDGGGDVALSELRHGAPVAIGRCRVEVRAPSEPEPPKPGAFGSGTGPWRGDVEPFPFPFRFGPPDSINKGQFDFDESGEWLMAVVIPHGPFHLWRIDGTTEEVLPRPMLHGEVLSNAAAVLGVIGGFVVFCRGEKHAAAVHYDLVSRRCTAHALDTRLNPWSWVYLRHLHSIVIRDVEGQPNALDLGVSKEDAAQTRRSVRARREASEALERAPVIVDGNRALPESGRGISIDPDAGTIVVQFAPGHRLSCTPQTEGRPKLKDGRIAQARSEGDLIAALVRTRRESLLEWFSIDESQPIGSFSLPLSVTSFALSRDGRRFAYRAGDRRLEVRDLGGGPLPRFTTPRGKRPTKLDVVLGPSFLAAMSGWHTHLIRWDRDRLRMSHDGEGDPTSLAARLPRLEAVHMVRASGLGPLKGHAYGNRFVDGCSAFGLTVLVDVFGQVAVLDSNKQLVCMFIFCRDKAAAWMPDGTRIGPAPVIGGPPTPEGAEQIGRALSRAQARSRGQGESVLWGERA